MSAIQSTSNFITQTEAILLVCEKHVEYRWIGYDEAEIRINHPDLEYKFLIDLENYPSDITNTQMLYREIVRHLVIDWNRVIYTRGL